MSVFSAATCITTLFRYLTQDDSHFGPRNYTVIADTHSVTETQNRPSGFWTYEHIEGHDFLHLDSSMTVPLIFVVYTMEQRQDNHW